VSERRTRAQRCRLIIDYQPTPDLDVGQAVMGITTNPCYLSQTEPVATALGWPLSQKTVRTGSLKVQHGPDLKPLKKNPTLCQKIYYCHPLECTQCFDNKVRLSHQWMPRSTLLRFRMIGIQDSTDGVEVCLTCFDGGCLDK